MQIPVKQPHVDEADRSPPPPCQNQTVGLKAEMAKQRLPSGIFVEGGLIKNFENAGVCTDAGLEGTQGGAADRPGCVHRGAGDHVVELHAQHMEFC